MRNNEEFSDYSQRSGAGNQPVMLISQLMQHAATMHHMDDMLQWLSNAVVQCVGTGAVQIWAMQGYSSGRYSAEIRATSENLSFPRQVYATSAFAGSIEGIFDKCIPYEKRSALSIPVTTIFPSSLANFFVQYRMLYWSCFYINSSDLLPPMQQGQTAEKFATPLRLLVSLFTQQSLPENALRAITFLLGQSLRIAKSRALFSVITDAPVKSHASSSQKTGKPNAHLLDLIPRRVQQEVIQQETNPFAHTTVIADKKARRLYFSIDGEKNIAELIDATDLDQPSMSGALQYLLKQRYIQLFEPRGQQVEDSLFSSLFNQFEAQH
jgi:hypothetical protein